MIGPDAEEGEALAGMRESRTIDLEAFRKNEYFKIASFNSRSINNKFQKIRDMTHTIAPVVLCVQETWGKNKTTEYSIRGYHKPEFSVRQGESMNLGGGVATWVREDTDFEVMKSPFKEKVIETQTIHLTEMNMIIVNVYRPFGSIDTFFDTLNQHLDNLKREEPLADILLMGDFNIDLMRVTKSSERLLEDTIIHGFIQRVTKPTRTTDNTESLIDHVYTKSRKHPYTDIIISDISDHYITVTTFPNESAKIKKTTITKRWFTRDSYTEIQQMLAAEDWSDLASQSEGHAL